MVATEEQTNKPWKVYSPKNTFVHHQSSPAPGSTQPNGVSFRIRPYIVESTCTRPITEVKPRLASPVLRWETTREQLVLYPFCLLPFCLLTLIYLFIVVEPSEWRREVLPLPPLYLSRLLLSVFLFISISLFATPCLLQFKRWRI